MKLIFENGVIPPENMVKAADKAPVMYANKGDKKEENDEQQAAERDT